MVVEEEVVFCRRNAVPDAIDAWLHQFIQHSHVLVSVFLCLVQSAGRNYNRWVSRFAQKKCLMVVRNGSSHRSSVLGCRPLVVTPWLMTETTRGSEAAVLT
jgi:hypothetical protein